MKQVTIKALALAAFILLLGGYSAQVEAFSKDSLVWEKCTSCHETSGGKISEVEDIRTTPEEWAVIVDRMARLHGMDLTGEEMGVLLKELCETQALTVEEQEKVAYLNLTNNTQFLETPADAKEQKLFTTCVRCHSAGKIYSYRMIDDAWAQLLDFHLYMTPTVVHQMREMRFVPEAKEVLADLAKDYPYGEAFKASDATPEGSWIVLGREPGKGNFSGTTTFKATDKGDFQLVGSIKFEDGCIETFKGEASLYGGHALRTYTKHNGLETRGAYSFSDGVIRGEHHYPAPDYRTTGSSWYPASGPAAVFKVSPSYLLKGDQTTLVVEGRDLPEVKAADIKFGNSDVKVLKAERVGDSLHLDVVYKGKKAETTSLEVKGLNAVDVTLAPQIDYIAVTPQMGRSRLDGGLYLPAESVQFEAIAFAKGDIELGPVEAHFGLEEEVTREEDDDLHWVGAIAENGHYSPSGNYGAISTREYMAEASGMVKVVAEYKHGKEVFKATARLAVVPPDYIKRLK